MQPPLRSETDCCMRDDNEEVSVSVDSTIVYLQLYYLVLPTSPTSVSHPGLARQRFNSDSLVDEGIRSYNRSKIRKRV